MGPVVIAPGFLFDIEACRLMDRGAQHPLRPKSAAVLAILVSHAGAVVSKADLLQQVWPAGFVGDSVLAVCVNELRHAFGDDPRRPRVIETVHRRGYRLIAAVAWGPASGSPAGELPGRADALGALGAWCAAALNGTPRVGFIVGTPGMGKTALLDTFVRGSGILPGVLLGRASCVERDTESEPYLPVLDALGSMCRGPGGAVAAELIRRDAPTWWRLLPGVGEPARVPSLPRLAEIGVALQALARDRLVVLTLDDLHAAGRRTTELLSYLARRVTSARLLVVAAMRPSARPGAGEPLRSLVTELSVHRLCERVVLGPLTADAIAEHLVARLGLDGCAVEVADVAARRTGGNPAVLTALEDDWIATTSTSCGVGDPRVSWWATAVPERVHWLVASQLGRLDELDRALLRGACAAGQEFSPARLGEASSVVGDAVIAGCLRLTRAGLLLPARPAAAPFARPALRYRLAHEMLRDIVTSTPQQLNKF